MEIDFKCRVNSYSTTSKSYKAFLACILRQKSKPSNPNLLVNLYLDCFLLFDKKICASTVIDAGLCDENKFTEWRKEQKRAGNLDWDSKSFGERMIYDYKIGAKLSKYIKLVADENGLVATKGYVDSKLKKVEEEFEEIKDAFDKLIAFFDRPVTPAKRIHYRANPDQLFLSKNGKAVMRKLLDEDEELDTTDSRIHPDYSKCLNN